MKTTTHCLLASAAACLAAPGYAQPFLHESELEISGQQLMANSPVGDSASDDDHGEKTAAQPGKNAEGSQPRGGKIEEVIVTAQKREERLQDVPISVSAIGGEALDVSRGSGLLEVLSSTPSVSTSEGPQGSLTILGIRGINATGSTFQGTSPIGFYLDSLPFGFVRSAAVPNLNPYDLDHVEVLRGPQGALYGASSLNGVVKILTKDPQLENFDAKALTSVSSTEGGGEGYGANMAINLPIVAGKWAARAVAGYEELGGWIDTPHRENVNEETVTNVRLKLKGQLTENLSLGLSGWRSRSDLGAPNIGDDQDRRTTDDREDNITKFNTAGLELHYQRSSFAVSSATSYIEYSTVSALSLQPFGLPAGTMFDTDLGAKILSEELLINSDATGRWRWSAGIFYREAQEDLLQRLAMNDLTYESRSIAYFGRLTRMLSDDRIEVAAGARYFEDEVDYHDNPGVINASPPFASSSDNFHKFSPNVSITWHASAELTCYASYGEGFRSGFSQFSAVSKTLGLNFPPAGPDELTNYEIGLKGGAFERKLDFEVAVYYIDWKDTQQVVSFQAPTGASFPVGVNAGTIDGAGVDVALTFRPLRGLELGGGYAWNDLSFTTPVFADGAVLFAKGFRPPLSAEETFGARVAYASPQFQNGWTGSVEATINYTSALGVVSVVDGVISSTTGDSTLIGRSSVSMKAPEHWTITAFVDNFNNSRAINTRAIVPPEWSTRIRPRTFGLQLAYAY